MTGAQRKRAPRTRTPQLACSAAIRFCRDPGAHSAGRSHPLELEAGAPLKTVSDLLGHNSVAVTGDIYGHVSDGAARAAVDRLSDALGW